MSPGGRAVEMESTARDALLAICQCTIVQETTEGESIYRLHGRVGAKLLGVNFRIFSGTDDAIRGMDFQIVFRFPDSLSFLRIMKNFLPSYAEKHQLSTIYIQP